MDTDSEGVETTQEDSHDEMRTDKTYSPDESGDTQSTIISDGQENNKKGNDIMSPSLEAAQRSAIETQITYSLQ